MGLTAAGSRLLSGGQFGEHQQGQDPEPEHRKDRQEFGDNQQGTTTA